MNKPSDLKEMLGSKSLREVAEIICKENKLLHVDVKFWEKKYNDLKIKYDILNLSYGDKQPTVAPTERKSSEGDKTPD